jgi:hypothetical protein
VSLVCNVVNVVLTNVVNVVLTIDQ